MENGANAEIKISYRMRSSVNILLICFFSVFSINFNIEFY